MSLEETKQLLRAYRITPNKLLGQNFMVEPAYYTRMCNYAKLDCSDVLLDAGAGLGFLSRFLSDKCKQVIAVEKDPRIAVALRKQVEACSNITVVEGDVLKSSLPLFNKVIAIPPYYISSELIVWLFERKVDCAILIVQKEFASRIVTSVGSEDYGWLTVFSFLHGETRLLDLVPKEMFYPQPEVDSIIIALKPKRHGPSQIQDEQLFIKMVRWLFSERNRKIGKAILPFLRTNFKLSKQEATSLALKLPYIDRRARELSPKDFEEIFIAVH